jgi:hypothetical protein
MSPSQSLSLRARFAFLGCTLVAAAVVVTSLGLVHSHFRSLAAAKTRGLRMRTEIVAERCAPVVTLRDSESGSRSLASLAADPAFEVAGLFDARRELVCHWPPDRKPPSRPFLRGGYRFRAPLSLEFAQPVIAAEQRIGTLYVRVSARDLLAALSADARYAGIVLLAALVLGRIHTKLTFSSFSAN